MSGEFILGDKKPGPTSLNKALIWSSFLYISFPASLFFYYWIVSPFNIICFVLFNVFFISQIISVTKTDFKYNLYLTDFIKIFLLALVMVWLSGASGIGGRSVFDIRHLVQKTLDFSIINPPVYYSQKDAYASYYFGFYIIPGLVNKYINSVNFILLIWESAGLSIGLAWIYLVLKKNYYRLIAIFMVSGLLSFIMPVINLENILTSRLFYFQDTFWVTLPVFIALRWVPSQLIYIMITLGLIIKIPQKHSLNLSSVLISGLFWAPFPTIVLGILYLVKIITVFLQTKPIKQIIFVAVNFFFAIFLILFLFSNKSIAGVVFNVNTADKFLKYIITLTLEFGVFYFLIDKKDRKNRLLIAGMIIIAVLPLFKHGFYNDFYTRGSQVIVLLLYIYFVKSISLNKKSIVRIIVFLMVAVLPLKFISFGLYSSGIEPIDIPEVANTYDLLLHDFEDETVANQYLMDSDSFFYKYILNKKHIVDQ